MKNMIHISSWIISSADIQWMLWIETGLHNSTWKSWLIITAYILIHLPYLKNEIEPANDACNIFTWNNILNTLTKFIIRQETPSIRITINYLSLLPWIVNLFAVFNTQRVVLFTCVFPLCGRFWLETLLSRSVVESKVRAKKHLEQIFQGSPVERIFQACVRSLIFRYSSKQMHTLLSISWTLLSQLIKLLAFRAQAEICGEDQSIGLKRY